MAGMHAGAHAVFEAILAAHVDYLASGAWIESPLATFRVAEGDRKSSIVFTLRCNAHLHAEINF